MDDDLDDLDDFDDEDTADDEEDDDDDDEDFGVGRKRQGSKAADSKKRGGLMKLAQAFSKAEASRSETSRAETSKAEASRAAASRAAAAGKVKLKTEDVWDTPDSSEAELKSRKDRPSSTKASKVRLSRHLFRFFSWLYPRDLNSPGENSKIIFI